MKFESPEGTRTVLWLVVVLVLALLLWQGLRTVLGAFAFGLFIYYATRRLERRLEDVFDRASVATFLTLLAFVVPALVVVAYAAAVALGELATLSNGGFPWLAEALEAADIEDPQTFYESVRADPTGALDERTRQLLVAALGSAGVIAGETFSVVVRVFLAFAFAFYLLRDDHRLGDWVRETFGRDSEAVTVLERADDDLETVFVGNVITIGVVGVLAVTTYLVLDFLAPAGTGVPYPFLFGMLTGLATLVPAIGIQIVYYPLAGAIFLFAWTTDGPLWFAPVFLVVTAVIVDVLPDLVLRPYLSSGRLHMGLVMFAYVLGALTFGWAGVFLGPILLVVALNVGEEVVPSLVDAATASE
ncbi:AI-2E family transporter [Halobacterium wangiae]|uniref:AI-2E family transporter n=1 Tax=Halobacterium wangiae TaxID=2902623 RepID=UPI001E53CDD8|nr:AI-2E family transporter [Halobacterium wangiae]